MAEFHLKFDMKKLVEDLPFRNRLEIAREFQRFDQTVTENGAYKWFTRGRIPLTRLLQLMVLARLRGVKLDVWDYIEVRRVKKRERSHA